MMQQRKHVCGIWRGADRALSPRSLQDKLGDISDGLSLGMSPTTRFEIEGAQGNGIVRRLCNFLNSRALLFLTIVALLPVLAVSQRSGRRCLSTPITKHEAQDLVKAIPDAIASTKIGGDLSVVDWKPKGYNTRKFYLFELLTTKSLPTTPLGNGVLGYFAVNKATGQVVELNSDRPAVEGPELRKLQDKLRVRHCISKDLVRRNLKVPLEN